MNPKFVVVGFDGLRADLVTERNTPNLMRLAERGVRFANQRSVFPTETRVNMTAISTGANAGRHGVVGNRYLDPKIDPEVPFNTFLRTMIDRGQIAYDGRLVEATSLGEMLHRGGKRMAVVASGSEGTSMMKMHDVRQLSGNLTVSCHYPGITTPDAVATEVAARFGPPPDIRHPDTAIVKYATDVFLDYVWPEHSPDVTILWFDEPDTSLHYLGLGTKETQATIQYCDAQFGRILDWAAAHPEVQVIAMSDHGHVAMTWGASVPQFLREAGFSVGDHLQGDADLAILPGHTGKLHARPEHRRTVLRDAVHAMMEQPWCGMMLAKAGIEIEGTLPQSLAFVEHPRSPDIYYTMRTDGGLGRDDLPGRTWYDTTGNALAPGAGQHGGLQKEEVNGFLIAAGSLFRQGVVSEVFSGIPDLHPTILHGLGLAPADSATGRPLLEALTDGPERPASPGIEEFTSAWGRYRQSLRRVKVAGATYLDHGYAETL
ncbi:alkaline phosphatase family protein [Pikeienuella piscinae]|uniref:Alkaline phosphatase family protein n=1 Tax=Pikeienuella piscinae TaxID=2748098 RepID=A0A7L5BW66_9RHOB|nr:alkaline phosphatase family protein [Pikeienuella piscinae]QIE56650.1 alkaline phosphatase family protein [Pikeienuella piscinae]